MHILWKTINWKWNTLGTKAHIQAIIPHVTICYNDNKKIDTNPLDSIPMWHCIIFQQW